ncbi:hypothetical protein B0A52_02858 [Exophiala mesophila]|uniref:Uncharacterized protein n=1 Tax=Exophiala mesophila TaxID=212818 RepID=A0A438NE35_EXOME|nr:hypothetical protein B0A52_02858 [Exophiala mesophila]
MQLSTPSMQHNKRQRSRDSALRVSRPASSGNSPFDDNDDSSHDYTTAADKRDDLAQHLSVKMPPYLTKGRSEISEAFQELEWRQRSRMAEAMRNPDSSQFRISRTPVTISRNRYANVQPWDAVRVKLDPAIDGSDYINASPIVLQSRRLKTKTSKSTKTPQSSDLALGENVSRYIATQGPKNGQFFHFWQMVMQETCGDVGVVIMLTRLSEGNREKCAQYYPAQESTPTMVLSSDEGKDSREGSQDDDEATPPPDGEQGDSSSGDQDEPTSRTLTITLISSRYDPAIRCEVRELQLDMDGQRKTIHHYLFNGWPDFGKPEAAERVALLELTKVSRLIAKDSPRFVHCSAGVGRTGTWIALDFLLQELEAGRLLESSATSTSSGAVSSPTWGRSGPPKATTPDPNDQEDLVSETVNCLREQRMMMVMNELQYSFIYEVLKDAFIDKYADRQTGPIVIEVQEPSPKMARTRSPQRERSRSEEDVVSEAETEIMDKDEENEDNDTVDDPYSAVAPDTIREGMKKQHQDTVQDHEAK